MVQGRDIGTSFPSNMKDFLKINGDLFFRGAKCLLMKCVSRQEWLTQLHRLHHDVCGVNLDASLYRRLQSLRVFWPEMTNDTKGEQRDCKTCSIIPPDQAEVLNSEVQEEDWQDPYLR